MNKPNDFIQNKHYLRCLVLILGMAAFCVGCASGPVYSTLQSSIKAPTDKGLVYVYSRTLPIGGTKGSKYRVFANTNEVCSLMGNNRFFYFYPNPGELYLNCGMRNPYLTGLLSGGGLIGGAIMSKKIKATLTIEPGQTYYVDIHNGFSGVKVVAMSKKEGEEEIQDCHLVEDQPQ
jgi:hypothetical protein